MNLVSGLWLLLVLGFLGLALLSLLEITRDMRALKNGRMIRLISKRHLHRGIGRVIFLVIAGAIAVPSLGQPTVWPTTASGWLLLLGFFALLLREGIDEGLDRRLRRQVKESG